MNIEPFDLNAHGQKKSLFNEEILFCDTGSLDALNFLRTAHAVVEQLDTADPARLRAGMIDALDTLIMHRVGCPNCNED